MPIEIQYSSDEDEETPSLPTSWRDYTFKKGKFAGKRLLDVVGTKEGRGYLRWLVKKEDVEYERLTALFKEALAYYDDKKDARKRNSSADEVPKRQSKKLKAVKEN